MTASLPSRFSAASTRLRALSLLLCAAALMPAARAGTVGHWRFEKGGFLSDSGPNGLPLTAAGKFGLPEQHVLPVGYDPGSSFPRAVGRFRNDAAARGQGKTSSFNHRQLVADISAHDDQLTSAMTIEAFVNLAYSHREDGAVLVGRGVSAPKGASWALAITGENSERGARNVLFQIVSTGIWSFDGIQTLESGLRLELGKDYYIAVAADFGQNASGGVTIYLKDLTDPDARLQVAKFARVRTAAASDLPLIIGANPVGGSPWYGLIDEVRVSDTKLSEPELLINTTATTP
ncbi:MAG: LamG-like jellyroll fold domain-containing protein [Verrucomicrobiota bacterium]